MNTQKKGSFYFHLLLYLFKGGKKKKKKAGRTRKAKICQIQLSKKKQKVFHLNVQD